MMKFVRWHDEDAITRGPLRTRVDVIIFDKKMFLIVDTDCWKPWIPMSINHNGLEKKEIW
jgi:hypothetical protein